MLWGLVGSATKDGEGVRSLNLLPFGLLFRDTSGPGISSIHILGTGVSHKEGTNNLGVTTCFRFLGIPFRTTHSASARVPTL